jgi:hypothetical protein
MNLFWLYDLPNTVFAAIVIGFLCRSACAVKDGRGGGSSGFRVMTADTTT